MTRFEDEYRKQLDAVDVDPGFAESVRRRADEVSPRSRADVRRGAAFGAGQVEELFEVSSGGETHGAIRPATARGAKGRPPSVAVRRFAVGAAAAAAIVVAVVVGVPAMVGEPAGGDPPDGAQVQPASRFSFDLKAAVAYADETTGEPDGDDAAEPQVYGPVMETGYSNLYLEGRQDASRRCFTASFRIDLSCVGEDIENVDYQLLGENGLGVDAEDREALMANDYVAEEGYAGCAWLFSNDRGDGADTRTGSAFSASVPEATSEVAREIVVATPMASAYDEKARDLAAAATSETYSEVESEIMAYGTLSCIEKLADVRISATAHFSDGSEQTKVYRLCLDGDPESEVKAWSDARRGQSQADGSQASDEPRFLTFLVEEVSEN